MRYTVLIDCCRSGYGVIVPDLPGCTAMGETIEAALANVAAAIRDWAETTEEAGGTVASPRDPEMLRNDPEVRAAMAAGAWLGSTPLNT